jgi:outer membrane protein assembly factor BamD (BamD/ComL family)
MTRTVRLVLAAAALAAGVLLSSCASGPSEIPAGLSAVEIFQRAQDASDRREYPLALRYYSLIAQDHPDDVNHLTWASYEIAFLYYKMGDHATALARVDELLEQYKTEGDKLPPAPRVLAVRLKAKLQPPQAAPGASTPAGTPAAPGGS